MKLSEFKPSVHQFYILQGKEEWLRVNAQTDLFGVSVDINRLRDKVYKQIGYDAFDDFSHPWPLEENMAEVLRQCMLDYPNSYLSEEFSYFLLRCGFDDNEVIGSLSPWNKIMFTWQETNMTVEKLESLLKEADLPHSLSEKSCTSINAWIANPISAIEQEEDVLPAIFGIRCINYDFDNDSGDQSAGKLFANFFKGLDLSNEITDSEQYFDGDWRDNYELVFNEIKQAESEEWQHYYTSGVSVVRFQFRGTEYLFYGNEDWGYVDVQAAMSNFDAFMEHIGREERVFRIRVREMSWQQGGYFIVGNPIKLEKLLATLGISAIRSPFDLLTDGNGVYVGTHPDGAKIPSLHLTSRTR